MGGIYPHLKEVGVGGGGQCPTYPGGRLCLYMHLSPPLGQVQSQPYLPFSTASMKNLHTLSVVVFGLPCLLNTTCRSFSSSQSSMPSFHLASSSASRVSWYRFFFSPFRSTAGSWLNLHFLPFSQLPCLKNMQSTVLGSTPKGTFCACTGLKSSAVSRLAASEAAFSRSFWAFSASFRFCSGVLAEAA